MSSVLSLFLIFIILFLVILALGFYINLLQNHLEALKSKLATMELMISESVRSEVVATKIEGSTTILQQSLVIGAGLFLVIVIIGLMLKAPSNNDNSITLDLLPQMFEKHSVQTNRFLTDQLTALNKGLELKFQSQTDLLQHLGLEVLDLKSKLLPIGDQISDSSLSKACEILNNF